MLALHPSRQLGVASRTRREDQRFHPWSLKTKLQVHSLPPLSPTGANGPSCLARLLLHPMLKGHWLQRQRRLGHLRLECRRSTAQTRQAHSLPPLSPTGANGPRLRVHKLLHPMFKGLRRSTAKTNTMVLLTTLPTRRIHSPPPLSPTGAKPGRCEESTPVHLCRSRMSIRTWMPDKNTTKATTRTEKTSWSKTNPGVPQFP